MDYNELEKKTIKIWPIEGITEEEFVKKVIIQSFAYAKGDQKKHLQFWKSLQTEYANVFDDLHKYIANGGMDTVSSKSKTLIFEAILGVGKKQVKLGKGRYEDNGIKFHSWSYENQKVNPIKYKKPSEFFWEKIDKQIEEVLMQEKSKIQKWKLFFQKQIMKYWYKQKIY